MEDLIWKVVELLIPVMIAIFTIIINEKNSRKRDLEHKKKELKIKYIEKSIQELQDISVQIMGYVRKSDSYLAKSNIEDRVKGYNVIANESSIIIENVKMFCGTYQCLICGLGLEIDLNEINNRVCTMSARILEIYKMYMRQSDSTQALYEEQHLESETLSVIEKSIRNLAKELAKLIT